MSTTTGLANTTWLDVSPCVGGHCGCPVNLFTYRDPASGAQCLNASGQTQMCHSVQGGVSCNGGTYAAAFGMQDGVAHTWGRKGTYWIKAVNQPGTP